MKMKKNLFTVIFGLIALTGFFIACSNNIVNPKSNKNSVAKLRIVYGENSARSVIPVTLTESDYDKAEVHITGQNNFDRTWTWLKDVNSTAIENMQNDALITLEVGKTYSVTLNLYIGEQLTAFQTKDVKPVEGQTELTFDTARNTNSGSGNVDVTLNFSGDVNGVKCGIYKADDMNNSISGYEAEILQINSSDTSLYVNYSKENVPAGIYVLRFDCYYDAECTKKLNSLTEVLYVEPGRVSYANRKLVEQSSLYSVFYHVEDNTGFTQNKSVYFTENMSIALPTYKAFSYNGYYLKGWTKDSDETLYSKKTFSVQDSALAGNSVKEHTFYPVWERGVYVDDTNKIIYAQGNSIIISGEHIYIDIDKNGVINTTDIDVKDINKAFKEKSSDLSLWTVKAGVPGVTDLKENKILDYDTDIRKDVLFTMTSGSIKELEGLSNNTYKSELKISGSVHIGNATTTNKVGLKADTFTDKKADIVGSITAGSKIILITSNIFDMITPRYLLYLANKDYAKIDYFECYTKYAGKENEKMNVGLKDVSINGSNKTVIRLSGDGVVIPDNITVSGTNPFTLGDSVVQTDCSVLSISVTNGYFQLGTASIAGTGLTYLAQPTPTTYDTSLQTNRDYVYMHILSSNSDITAASAAEFISKIKFRRSNANTPITIKVNVETVPASVISSTRSQYKSFAYFDGSFYGGVYTGANTWIYAYNQAKRKIFNNMTGYLMNITSEVENNYIYSQMGLGASWFGGARMYPTSGQFDTSNEVSKRSFITGTTQHFFYWQSGPEAGKWCEVGYVNGNSGAGKWVSQTYTNATNYSYETGKTGNPSDYTGFKKWGDGEPNDSDNGNGSEEAIQYLSGGSWNDLSCMSTTPTGYVVEFTPYSTEYATCTPNYSSCKDIKEY